tara:strand:- start:55493 stop:56770 length:1278 start_codon:yes stop_codon:yes gene_type:complete
MDLDKGYFEFHKRSFAMSTINEGDLDDYFTFATGAGLGYYSPSFHGFHLGFSGFFVFQLYNYNLESIDEPTGQSSRYERQLYDLNDVDNSKDLDRLEEFFLTYEKEHFELELGRQKFESPLLNENDNRMRPNIFNGLTAQYHKDHLNFIAGWFISEAVRGTVHWYKIDHTLGIYDQGRNPLSDSLSYHGHISTKGIGVLGVEHEKKEWDFQAWNYTAENIFNLSFGQIDHELKKEKFNLLFGLQGLYQYSLNHGGNKDQRLTYILKNESTFAIGGRMGIKRKNHELTANYFGISKNGRYLFPREWGREKFYASQPREIFEGNGGLNSYVIKYKFEPVNKPYYLSFGAGYIDQPQLDDERLNKYAIDDYYHLSSKFDYKFEGYLEGLDIQCLLVCKIEAEDGSMSHAQKINTTDMLNLNLIIDYRF